MEAVFRFLEKYRSYFLVLICLIVGAYLRFHHIGLRTFWLDEASSATLIKYNFSDLWREIAQKDSCPAYLFFLKIWSLLFGDSEFALRSFSATAGLLSIAAIYRLGKMLFGKTAGLWAGFLLSINYFGIFYAIQARPYSLAILFSILSYYYFVKLIRNEKSALNVILYIVVTAVGIYIHIWFFLILGSQILYWLIKKAAKRSYFIFAIYPVFIILLSLPWASTLLRFGKNGASDCYGPAKLSAFSETFNYFMFGSAAVYIIFSLIVLASYFIGIKKEEEGDIVRYRLVEKTSGIKINENAYLLLNYLFFPLISAWIISQFVPIYLTGRHEAVVLPAFILLVAGFWSTFPNKKIILAAALILIALGIRSAEADKQAINSYKINDRTIARDLINNMTGNDVIIFTGLSRPSFDYYLPRVNTENKKYLEISFPEEMEHHPAFQSIRIMNTKIDKISFEADALIEKITNLKPSHIWIIFASGNPASEILREKMDEKFKLIESTSFLDPETSAPQADVSPLHFQYILEYE
ncbi:MAG: glycosyltransferase family 39 protein [Candidatus Moranbacteria bacterium]|nr:glycosyltransferase family 39 protein [Candidatus Moranbacteria bacterium]